MNGSLMTTSPINRCLARAILFCAFHFLAVLTYGFAQTPSWETISAEGKAAFSERRYSDAERLHSRAVAQAEKFGKQDLRLASSLFDLGVVCYAQGKNGEAEKHLKRTLEIREKVQGPDDAEVGIALGQLAEVYRALKRYKEAEPLYQRAMIIAENTKPIDQERLGSIFLDLGLMYSAQGRLADAETRYKQAIPRFESVGASHIALGYTLFNLAELYQAGRRFADAEPRYIQAVQIFEKASGPQSTNVAMALESYSRLLRAAGRETEAVTVENRAKAIRQNPKR